MLPYFLLFLHRNRGWASWEGEGLQGEDQLSDHGNEPAGGREPWAQCGLRAQFLVQSHPSVLPQETRAQRGCGPCGGSHSPEKLGWRHPRVDPPGQLHCALSSRKPLRSAALEEKRNGFGYVTVTSRPSQALCPENNLLGGQRVEASRPGAGEVAEGWLPGAGRRLQVLCPEPAPEGGGTRWVARSWCWQPLGDLCKIL